MKKYSFIVAISFFIINSVIFAQNNKAKADDFGRIILSSYVPDQIEGMPEIAKANLTNKLSQIATQSGMGGGIPSRFIITANISVDSKDVVGVPAKFMMNLNVTLYIGDAVDGTQFSSTSIPVSGVGSNETQAYLQALNKINVKAAGFKDFIENGKNKIMEYYNSRCDLIIKEAFSQVSRNEFDNAILNLLAVPDVCKECYTKCMDTISTVYTLKLDRECNGKMSNSEIFLAKNQFDEAADALSGIFKGSNCYKASREIRQKIVDQKCSQSLGKANGAWAGKDVEATSEALKEIPSDSKCSAEAQQIAKEVKAWVKQKDQREWNLEVKKDQDDMDIKTMTINAAREIGVANANNRPKVVYNTKIINRWFGY